MHARRCCTPGVAAGTAAVGALLDAAGAAAFGCADSGTLPAVGCAAARPHAVNHGVVSHRTCYLYTFGSVWHAHPQQVAAYVGTGRLDVI